MAHWRSAAEVLHHHCRRLRPTLPTRVDSLVKQPEADGAVRRRLHPDGNLGVDLEPQQLARRLVGAEEVAKLLHAAPLLVGLVLLGRLPRLLLGLLARLLLVVAVVVVLLVLLVLLLVLLVLVLVLGLLVELVLLEDERAELVLHVDGLARAVASDAVAATAAAALGTDTPNTDHHRWQQVFAAQQLAICFLAWVVLELLLQRDGWLLGLDTEHGCFCRLW